MASDAQSVPVDSFLTALHHPKIDEIRRLRTLILESHEGVEEHIKWNAPSFLFRGDDRITFNLHSRDRVQIIFHRGAKTKSIADFRFDDAPAFVKWAAKDRGVVAFASLEEVEAHRDALQAFARRWLDATLD